MRSHNLTRRPRLGMALSAVCTVTALVASTPAAAAPAFAVPAGEVTAHPCRASYEGRPLFAGRCMINTKARETLVFAPEDGCTLTLKPHGTGFTGELSAYRNSCVLDAATEREVDDPIRLGPLHRAGSCWTGAGAQVCVER